MYDVHLIQSIANPTQYYVGVTEDIDRRLRDHNGGNLGHTAKYRPWELVVMIGFKSKARATTSSGI